MSDHPGICFNHKEGSTLLYQYRPNHLIQDHDARQLFMWSSAGDKDEAERQIMIQTFS